MTPPEPLPTAASGLSALDVARRCAHEGGRLALQRFRRPQEIAVKGRGNLVTNTDFDIERLIHEILRAEYPSHAVLSEEAAPETPAPTPESPAWLWVVDPLDGTRNYVSGIPYFCVNVALCHRGDPVLGVTFAPCQEETFWAQRGAGAFVGGSAALTGTGTRPVSVPRYVRQSLEGTKFNPSSAAGELLDRLHEADADDLPDVAREWLGRAAVRPQSRITASDRPDVRTSVLGCDLGYDDRRAARMLSLVAAIWPGLEGVRVQGSAALGLAYAACGRYDVFLHHYLLPWDVAAGIVLVREAGGVITDRDGGPATIYSEGVVAGGAAVHADLMRLAKGHPWRDEGAAVK